MKIFLLFSILPVLGTAAGSPTKAGPHTEAGFSVTCAGCGTDPDPKAQSLNNLTECLAHLKECQDVPEEHRMTCEETDSLGDYAKSAGQSVLLCGEYLLDSADFLWELLQGVLKFSAASIFDSKMREKNAESLLSMKNYLAIEFYKAYRESEGTKAEKFLAAFADLGGDSWDALFSWIKNFIHEQAASFKCYKGTAQTAVLCSVAVGLMIPIPGSSFFSSLSLALKTGRLPLKTKNLLKQKTEEAMSAFKKNSGKRNPVRLSGAKLKSTADRVYRDMSSKILSASKDMPKSLQKEVARLFSQPEALKSKLEIAIKKTGGNINSVTLTAALAGVLVSYRIALLSKESAEFVIKEAADLLSTDYVDKLLAEGQRSDGQNPATYP